MPIRASLTIMAIAAAIWILDRGQEFFVPLIASGLLAFTLMPLVRLGERARIPAAVVATVILLGAGIGGGAVVSANAEDAARLVRQMPELTEFILTKVRRLLLVADGRPPDGMHLGSVASGGPSLPDAGADPLALLSQEPAGSQTGLETIAGPEHMRDLAATAAAQIASGAGKAFAIALLTFFLLLSADNLKAKLFNLAGERLSQKKIALRALEESARQIQLYLLITVVVNLIVGLLAWLLLWTIGVESAAAWAIALGIAHTVPYVGAIAGTLLISMAAVFQFESWQVGLQVLCGLGAICAVAGTVIMTLMQGKAAHIDPAILFIGLLLFTWLWGPWGLLLGAPIIAVTKTVSSYAGANRLNEVLES